MSLFAIGDLHLSLGGDKPMDVFGGVWENHTDKLTAGFSDLSEDDVCVICGDISWAMSLDAASEDFKFIGALPGKKIILKGNHDYWWSTAAKAGRRMRELGIDSIDFLHNNFFPFGENAAVCGTRGWFYEEEKGDAHDEKIMRREILRLESSLRAAQEREKYVFLHYPPIFAHYTCEEILELLEKYSVKICCAGHIHGEGLRHSFEGTHRGTRHALVSADRLDFRPMKIL